MTTTRRLLTLALAALALISLSACRSSATSDPTTTAGPMNERDRLRAERWTTASEGLDFEASSGLVEVQRIPSGNAAIASQHLAEARELLDGNRIVDAFEAFGLAARNEPELSDAYLGMGVVLDRKGKIDDAIRSFETALDRDRDNLDARYELATTLWTADRKDDAIAEMQRLVTADDEQARAHERLAVWYYYTDSPEVAWQHLERAEELGGAVPAQLVPLLQKQLADAGID